MSFLTDSEKLMICDFLKGGKHEKKYIVLRHGFLFFLECFIYTEFGLCLTEFLMHHS